MRRKRGRQGFVYFIRAGFLGPIKIGFSEKPLLRLGELQTAHYEKLRLLGQMQASDQLEGELHMAMKASRIRGEWYQPTRDVLRVVILHINNPGTVATLAQEYDAVCEPLPPQLPLVQISRKQPYRVYWRGRKTPVVAPPVLVPSDDDNTRACIARRIEARHALKRNRTVVV